jgi:DNA-binding HxlR family transcriptional regulator
MQTSEIKIKIVSSHWKIDIIVSLNDDKWNRIGAYTHFGDLKRHVVVLTSTAEMRAVGKV